tara:strand:+ start:28 stop:354 length:327 start_codon:yes stop_codon:yes gene_type:complete
MKILTKEIEAKLSKNIGNATKDKPYLKLFNPMGSATWLLSEYHEEDRTFFGLCDLGMGFPELGYVSLDEIESVRLPFGLTIERDIHFEPTKTLSEYAAEARELGSIRA